MIPIGKELKRKNYYLLNPSRYVVSLKEFEQLKKDNNEEATGFSYEDYCEIEREGLNDIIKSLFHKPFELLDIIPKSKPWRNGIKRVIENNIQSHLPVLFENNVITANG